jgi:hypothetical protein
MATNKPGKPGKKPLTEAEKAARKASLANESKAQRFVRVATPRVKKAIKAIDAVSQCTGSRYEYTEEQRDKILTAIGNAATNLRNRLMNEKAADTGFSL